MTGVLITALVVIGFAIGITAGWWLPPHGRRQSAERAPTVRRILLPFAGSVISRRAFEAAVRLARAENATIMPAYLARVPRQLALDTPLPIQCTEAMPLLEAIEQRAAGLGIPVDARVSRGRSYRDALQRLLASEQFDRVIVSATDNERTGLSADDLKWLLERVPAEILILRPDFEDHRTVSADVNGHF
jgi:nucleotide-binding universal stress UspA family protein